MSHLRKLYTKEVEKFSIDNKQSMPVCPLCGGEGKVWRMNWAGAQDWYDCECKSGKPAHIG